MAMSVKDLAFYIILAVLFAVSGFLTTLLIPSLILQLAWLALDGQSPSGIYLLGLIGLALARGLFRYGEHYFGHYVAFRSLYKFRVKVFSKLRRLAPAKLDSKDSGHLLKMIGEDIEAMEVFFAHTLPPLLTATLVTIGLAFYYFRLSPLIGVVALVTYAILAIALPKLFAQRLHLLLSSQNQARLSYLSVFSDSLRGMKELLQFAKTEHAFRQLNEQSKFVNQKEKEVAVTTYMQASLTFLVIGLAILLVALLAFKAYLSGQIGLQETATLIVLFATSFAPYLELSRLPLGFKRAINAARQVYGLLDEPEIDRSGRDLSSELTTIKLEKVSFTYPNREQEIFNQLTHTFPKHQIIGLLGKSGSGKSTLMKLIMRWYDTTKGAILLNGNPVTDLSGRSVQDKIAYIPQIPQIFSQTIRENLTLGDPTISDAFILEMAEKCRIKERILASKDGLDTLLNSEQELFSAGELQRLELTRALIKQAECYIFDEPTSNLDSLNEASFLQVIREHCKGYVFLISHRQSTISCADKIVRVEKGRLKEY